MREVETGTIAAIRCLEVIDHEGGMGRLVASKGSEGDEAERSVGVVDRL